MQCNSVHHAPYTTVVYAVADKKHSDSRDTTKDTDEKKDSNIKMLQDIQENEAPAVFNRSWSDSNSDIVQVVSEPRTSLRTGRQRSVSLPDGGVSPSYGKIPSIEDVQSLRGGWDRLGLYIKGLPPKSLVNARSARYRKVLADYVDKSMGELDLSASQAMLAMKSDQKSQAARAYWQERQFNIVLSSLAEEITAAKVTVKTLEHDQPVAAEDITDKFEALQEKLAKLISNSQDYGKLKYEENLSKQLDMLQIYADSLVRGREAICREIKEINNNINDDKIAIAIARKQEETSGSIEEKDPDVNDFENVVEQTEQFLKKFSVGGSNKKIQDKLEPSHIAASAVQELINLRGMQKQRKVTFSEDVDADIEEGLDDSWRYKVVVDTLKEIWETVHEVSENIDIPGSLFVLRHIAGVLLFSTGVYLIFVSVLL